MKYAPALCARLATKVARKSSPPKSKTTGAPTALQLTPHRATLKADGADVSVITVHVNDAQGRMIPTAADEITFTLSGPGKIIGVGNGDPSSHEPEQFPDKDGSPAPVWRRSLFNGLAQVIVQSTGQTGEITLTANASGLTAAGLTLSAVGTK